MRSSYVFAGKGTVLRTLTANEVRLVLAEPWTPAGPSLDSGLFSSLRRWH